jgi:hypothetical protein
MSRDLRRPKQSFAVSGFVFVGLVSLFSVWRVFYRPHNILMPVMWLGLMDTGGAERDIIYLSYLRVHVLK